MEFKIAVAKKGKKSFVKITAYNPATKETLREETFPCDTDQLEYFLNEITKSLGDHFCECTVI